MKPVLKHDIRELMVDTEDVKRALDMLEQDQATWARKREEKDLKKIIERVKGLEFDVSTMMSDCFSLTHHEGDSGLSDDLDRAFANLNALFGDLTEIRAELNSSYIHPGELRQVEIDWERFRKSIGQIQKDLQDADKSPKTEKGKITRKKYHFKEELKMKDRNATTRKLVGYFFLIVIMTFFLIDQSAHAAFLGFGEKAPPSFADLAEEVEHSVVNISTTQVIKGSPLQPFFGPNAPFGEFFGRDFFKHFFGNIPQGQMKTHALGSGFIISEDGLILTNNHVIDKATEIKVKLESGKEYDAKVIGRDPKTDLALIRVKVDADFPTPAHLGDSDAIRVGDYVMAVGNPFGLGQTVTTGIISAKGRIIGAGPYDDFLQTDAAINPGNSGGPLFNMKGQVVGINTAIVAQAQNIGFAIPVNIAKELLPQLKSGKIIRGWLGVMIQDITPELAKSFNLKETKGVLISDVTKGSPAEKAGLRRGDVVKQFNGKEAENAHTLSRVVAATPPGTKVMLDIMRNGKEKTIKLTIGTMPQKAVQQLPEKATTWGLTVQEITPDLAQQLGLSPKEKGVVISGVEPASPAAEAGLHPGDVIKEVNRQSIQNLNDYNQALEKVKKSESVLLLIKRGSGTLYVVLKSAS